MRHVTLLALLAAACGSTRPESQAQADMLDAECRAAIERAKSVDPGMARWFESAHGYAIFPSVAKAGFFLGAGRGKGQVYEQGRVVGYASITQGTAGLQIGAQTFVEIIFFKDKLALDAFKDDNFEFAAEVSAVALEKGSSAKADYSGGVAVFVFAEGGLMVEASVGGQKFDYGRK